jgi:hypothetical protein
MPVKTLKAFLWLILIACNNNQAGISPARKIFSLKDTAKRYSIVKDIRLPNGYIRINDEEGSFGDFLADIHLKISNTVYLYNGQPKQNQSAQFAVLDISVGDKDLQQCADAVMRLRAEFLYKENLDDQIIFTDNEGTAYAFKSPHTRVNFDNYLQRVFGMCGSASLAKQLKASSIENIKPGDVLIRGGFPGHAVIVMDVAVNEKGQKIFLLAQSYMPAQDIHILKNPNDEKLSPWYAVDTMQDIITPEYIFSPKELRQW